MRIIAGELRGRRLRPVPGRKIRPTGDKVREAVFDILASRYELPGTDGTRVLDLYAGTGALGIEAISRGAAWATFVEVEAEAAATVRANLEHCHVGDRGEVRRLSVEAFLARNAAAVSGDGGDGFNLAFLDPPYDAGDDLAATLASLGPPLIAPGAVIVVEHPAAGPPPDAAGLLTLVDRRKWGQTGVSFYRPESEAPSAA